MKSNHYSLLKLYLLILLCFGLRSEINATLNKDEILHAGRKYSEWFFSSRLDSLINLIIDSNYKLSDLQNFRVHVGKQLGEEVKILNEQFGEEPDQYYYIRYSRFSAVSQPVRTLFTFSEVNHIYQFSVNILPNESPSRFHNYESKTNLILPFHGEWMVAWGGRKINENQHAVSKSQRFAYDYLIRKGTKTFMGTGTSNLDYFSYQQEIFAPGPGKVVEVINDIDDNQIGVMPEIHGNRVIIDHGNGEYSVLSHFKKKSIVVKNNEFIKSGQLLGLCGNSGHSSEPHIHYHLQNTKDIDLGEGLPIKFQNYKSNGKLIEKGEPIIGERIRNYVK